MMAGTRCGGEGSSAKRADARRPGTRWCGRLAGAAHDRSFHGTESEQVYPTGRTGRDYAWNVVGMGSWGLVFPVLTIVVTQLCGADPAGMFSMAYVVAELLMILANFGVRTYQVSDLEERCSFADYRVNRLLTCFLALAVGAAYCIARGYSARMATVCMSVVFYKVMDGLADVYEGRLQQVGKMYLAGVSMTVRSAVVFAAFSATLLATRSLPASCVAMALAALLDVAAVTLPLAHLESDKSRRADAHRVFRLLGQSWPLFGALFCYTLMTGMPKFVMEGSLPYESQLYYNVLSFPASFVVMTAQTAYRPMLVRVAGAWRDPRGRKRFDTAVLSVLAGIAALAALAAAAMEWVGLDVFGLIYGLDFGRFGGVCTAMVAAGGMAAGADFLSQAVTVLRRQRDMVPAYAAAFALSLLASTVLVGSHGLAGAAASYLATMSALFLLMLLTYVRARTGRGGRRRARRGTVSLRDLETGARQDVVDGD